MAFYIRYPHQVPNIFITYKRHNFSDIQKIFRSKYYNLLKLKGDRLNPLITSMFRYSELVRLLQNAAFCHITDMISENLSSCITTYFEIQLKVPYK